MTISLKSFWHVIAELEHLTDYVRLYTKVSLVMHVQSIIGREINKTSDLHAQVVCLCNNQPNLKMQRLLLQILLQY